MAAASSISMAATASSSSFCLHRISNISFTCSYFSHSIRQKAKPLPKIKTLKPYLSIITLPLSHRFCVAAYSNSVEEEDEEEVEEEEEASTNGTRLYVGNLPYSMTSAQLAEIFSEAGRVESVEIVYDRVTDRSRGFGFVTMGSVEEAKEAMRMFNGSQVGGRTVKVNFPEVPRGGEREVMGPRMRGSHRGFVESSYKIYAGNLGWTLTSEALKDAFADQPGVLGAKVLYERDSGRSRGFGFVSFVSEEEAQSAIDAMNGVEVEGRPLRLNLAAERGRTPMQSGTGY
eukprot:TRINITY_DN1666_c1_g1_i1.p1 TRINITY_DN1666_c1_g1~~TRINITY_DN1666_c1_g1_i1.p1  ORF type:complete len:287 (-),score=56.23 TRINITY_DN1666_c1_g1_i1:614-1474(-)